MVVKQYASAFFGTSLASTLVRGRGHRGDRRRLDVRLRTGDRHGRAEPGFRPQVVRDRCADRTPGAREQPRDLDAKYADVVELDEALAHL